MAKHHETAAEVYRTLMEWLEVLPKIGTIDSLTIPVKDGETVKALNFRKGIGMGSTAWAVSMQDPNVQIDYDPHWRDLEKIQGLIDKV